MKVGVVMAVPGYSKKGKGEEEGGKREGRGRQREGRERERSRKGYAVIGSL
jgi:hypothetical protein